MIVIGADIVPTESNLDFFTRGDLHSIIPKDLLDLLSAADLCVFNLETPLTDELDPIDKNGPTLVAPTACVSGLMELGIDLLSLANNHIKDQNEKGIISTINTLKKAGIAYIGAGKNINEASKPAVYIIDGKRIGIYACAEHEFSIADEEHWGANPFDPLESLDHIYNLKKECDYIIVLYHGGKEHYRYPSPNLQKTCRKIIEKGADIVICQHSHCIGCMETHQNGTIVYGQGNFLFDKADNEFWNTSLLITITNEGKINYIPLIKTKNTVEIAKNKEADEIIQQFIHRSECIKRKGFVEEEYNLFAKDKLPDYYMSFTGKGKNLLYRVVNKISKNKFHIYMAKRYKNMMGTSVSNLIECEAHRELVLKSFKK